MTNTLHLLLATALVALCFSAAASQESAAAALQLELLGQYNQPDPAAAFDRSAAEIIAYDASSKRLFVTNGYSKTLDIVDLSTIGAPKFIAAIDVASNPDFGSFSGGGANSVAVSHGIVAAAVEAADKAQPGVVALFDTDGKLLKLVPVGALPDMLTFTPDGRKILVANEGEPVGGEDPEGSVSIIELGKGAGKASATTVDFHGFDQSVDAMRASGVRLFPDVAIPPLSKGKISVSQDLEPEYIAVAADGKTAMVVLQEASAIAMLDIDRALIVDIKALGSKNYHADGAGLDPSDRDGGIHIKPWPLKGLYMPDGIASYSVAGASYYIIANEGDDRGDADEESRGDAIRYGDIHAVRSFGREGLNASETLRAQNLDRDKRLGRLLISSIDGLNSDGELEQLYAYGGRSFSILDAGGAIIWDSGDQLEKITAARLAPFFNASNDANRDKETDSRPAIDARSASKGPEPEAVTIASLYGRHYAFIGLERIGGVAIYDVTRPRAPEFVDYINRRDFDVSNVELEQGKAGDLGPESLLVIAAHESPTGHPLLIVANEVSGSISIFEITPTKER